MVGLVGHRSWVSYMVERGGQEALRTFGLEERSSMQVSNVE